MNLVRERCSLQDSLPSPLLVAVVMLQTAMPILIRISYRILASDSNNQVEQRGEDVPAGRTQETTAFYPASITLVAEVLKCIIAYVFLIKVVSESKQAYSSRVGGYD